LPAIRNATVVIADTRPLLPRFVSLHTWNCQRSVAKPQINMRSPVFRKTKLCCCFYQTAAVTSHWFNSLIRNNIWSISAVQVDYDMGDPPFYRVRICAAVWFMKKCLKC